MKNFPYRTCIKQKKVLTKKKSLKNYLQMMKSLCRTIKDSKEKGGYELKIVYNNF